MRYFVIVVLGLTVLGLCSGHLVKRQDSAIANDTAEAPVVQRSREDIEKELLARGLVVMEGTAEALHNDILFADPVSITLGEEALDELLSIPFSFRSRTTFRPLISGSDDFGIALHLPVAFDSPAQFIPSCKETPCTDIGKYRTYDGSCNNPKHKDWGKSHTAFQRFMPPKYKDGISEPRSGFNGTQLPSARLVSTTVLNYVDVPELTNISAFFMAFGQFVDHDLTLTPTTRGANGTTFLCCPPKITPDLRHPECMTIDVPENDPFYSKFSFTCMEFVRTIPAPPNECQIGLHREQLNQLTNYVDASMIYGSDAEQADKLRAKSGGKLDGIVRGIHEFPPHSKVSRCMKDEDQFCFITGDVRSAEQPGLVSIHIAVFREHNRIADELALLNPHWDDEILYQETRRIMGAIMQRIIYREYLPVIVGDDIMTKYNLTLKDEGYDDPYDPDVNPSIFNEFATAAFRFGHSAVPSSIKLVDKDNHITTQVFHDHFLQPFDIKLYNDYLRGLLVQSSEIVDEAFTSEITNHLFQSNGQFGLDLTALNIQRGRDHALGTYAEARLFCGLEPITSFNDLSKHMNTDVASRLSQVYTHVEDIDLFIGGIVEHRLPGAAVGPTIACIIAEQFRRLKVGDRFWHERGDVKWAFSEDQLREIRNMSLARILCDNSEIDKVQPLVMWSESPKNLQVKCDSYDIPWMTVLPWKN